MNPWHETKSEIPEYMPVFVQNWVILQDDVI